MNAKTNDEFRTQGARKATLSILATLTDREDDPIGGMLACQLPNPITGNMNAVVLTPGIQALGYRGAGQVMMKVFKFDTFTADNDPYGEHDFGSLDHEGQKVFWKIDDYAGHDGMELILTIMMADEY